MGSFFRSIYWKLSAVFLILLVFVGAAYTYLTLFSSEMYFAETNQRLNAALAQHIVEDVKPFFTDGKPNQPVLSELFHDVMVVNPAVEVYLLDAHGSIVAFDAPREKVKLTSVSLEPVQEFIGSGGKKLVLGDNPRDARKPRVFSAAPIVEEGKLLGYVYVILRGEEFDSIAERILSSHILTLGLRGLVLSILAAAAIGLIALAMVTRKLRRLTRTALAFRDGDYSQRVRITSRDELDELGEAFNAMADSLARHVEDLQRMDTLRRELIANVSHDLRTPLASMQGYLETVLIKDKSLTLEERRNYLGVIFSNTERLSKLVQELFELSKLEAKQTRPHAEPFSLAELGNDLVQKFVPIAGKKGVKLTAHFQENLPFVSADIGLIERVMQNLIDNAIAYTNHGGEVKLILDRDGEKLRVILEDTGVGIPEGDLPFVFDRFYQSRTRGKTGGAGLGLAIVKKILEAHGETISVESRVNQGTRFTFELPCVVLRKSAAA